MVDAEAVDLREIRVPNYMSALNVQNAFKQLLVC